MIVVAGGSGRLGRAVVAGLADRGEQVRVLVRNVERARTVLGADVEVVGHDVRFPAGLSDLLNGASTVVSAVHGLLGGRRTGPAAVDRRGNIDLIDAAATVGAHVVLTSVLDAAADSAFDLSRAKYAAEQHLRATPTGWTIVRAGPFLETWLDILTQTAGNSGRPVIFGRGQRPIGFVSVIDVATLIIRAGCPAAHGQILEAAGTPMTMNELARTLQTARGWPGPERHLPRPMVRALGTLARPVNSAFARKNRAALLMDTVALVGTSEMADLLGRRPTQLADILGTLLGERQT